LSFFFTLVKEADLGGNEQGIDYVIEKQLASAVKKVFSIYGAGMQIASCRDPSCRALRAGRRLLVPRNP
jgi:hypothetical protein